MSRNSRPMPLKSLGTKLTALEKGLKGAIFADDKAKRAFLHKQLDVTPLKNSY
jgi:hypothetical protein